MNAPLVLDRAAIVQRLDKRDAAIVAAMESAFAALGRGEVVVPPVGHLDFEEPFGDCHIKYGYVRGAARFAVKIATGFYDNPKLGLPTGDGAVLVFSQRTGLLEAVLLDGGELTNLRTAAAGALAAKLLARREVSCIGIVGTGVQARLQASFLRTVTLCRSLVLWGRSEPAAERCALDLEALGFAVTRAREPSELACADLLVTTTPSKVPLVHGAWLASGTHVTAVGADGGGKRELDGEVFRRADVVVVDSRSQCEHYGDVSFALNEGAISSDRIVELGTLIARPVLGRRAESDITVCDLTGVAVQDIAIADMVL